MDLALDFSKPKLSKFLIWIQSMCIGYQNMSKRWGERKRERERCPTNEKQHEASNSCKRLCKDSLRSGVSSGGYSARRRLRTLHCHKHKETEPGVSKGWFLVPKCVDNEHPYPPIGIPLWLLIFTTVLVLFIVCCNGHAVGMMKSWLGKKKTRVVCWLEDRLSYQVCY